MGTVALISASHTRPSLLQSPVLTFISIDQRTAHHAQAGGQCHQWSLQIKTLHVV